MPNIIKEYEVIWSKEARGALARSIPSKVDSKSLLISPLDKHELPIIPVSYLMNTNRLWSKK
jgi:hypothetical protein